MPIAKKLTTMPIAKKSSSKITPGYTIVETKTKTVPPRNTETGKFVSSSNNSAVNEIAKSMAKLTTKSNNVSSTSLTLTVRNRKT